MCLIGGLKKFVEKPAPRVGYRLFEVGRNGELCSTFAKYTYKAQTVTCTKNRRVTPETTGCDKSGFWVYWDKSEAFDAACSQEVVAKVICFGPRAVHERGCRTNSLTIVAADYLRESLPYDYFTFSEREAKAARKKNEVALKRTLDKLKKRYPDVPFGVSDYCYEED